MLDRGVAVVALALLVPLLLGTVLTVYDAWSDSQRLVVTKDARVDTVTAHVPEDNRETLRVRREPLHGGIELGAEPAAEAGAAHPAATIPPKMPRSWGAGSYAASLGLGFSSTA